ncbi:MAG: trimeric intracellular cation channel family protein [Bacteroidaceae bacterium]|jgi:uncharacterized membrane protein YeiH
MITITSVLEFIGTFAAAISGIRLASNKRFDWFGAYVVGVATAIGGGTLRDIQLDVTPFWMTSPIYLIASALAFLWVLLFRETLNRWAQTFFLFDAIGLALFTVVGIDKSLANGYPFWVAITMGCVTGAAGGVIRDILINEIPLIFRKDFYAMSSICGGIIYWQSYIHGLSAPYLQILTGTSVFLIRLLGAHFQIGLPIMHETEEEHPEEPKS